MGDIAFDRTQPVTKENLQKLLKTTTEAQHFFRIASDWARDAQEPVATKTRKSSKAA